MDEDQGQNLQRPAMKQTEEILNRVGWNLGVFKSMSCRHLASSAAFGEEAEDVWAERYITHMQPEYVPIRPPDELNYVGKGQEAFEGVGEEFFRHFVELADLKPDHRVLDVGCGLGRMAIPLTGYLNTKGSYEGFDIVAEAVRWCQENITPRYPNFRFQLADLSNKRYNKRGKYRAEKYVFPYEDESFDFVFLASVFTHMLPEEVRNYTSEISRVLKPGGRCLITYFLLNEESMKLIEEGKDSLGFHHTYGKWCRVVAPKRPEKAIAYDERFIRRLYHREGLMIAKPVGYGCWCGREEFLSYQDIIVAAKQRQSTGGGILELLRRWLVSLFIREGHSLS